MEGKTEKKLSKKIWIPVVVLVLLAVLFMPFFSGVMDDGGTRVYSALTYKVVKWNRLLGMGNEQYEATRVYFFPKNFKPVDTLWELEGVDESVYMKREEESFEAKIVELSILTAKVEVMEPDWNCSDVISFSVKDLEPIEAEVGDIVEVFYNGIIQTSYPAGISASSWKLSEKNKELAYSGQWLDKTTAEGYDSNVFNFNDLRITKIYSDCFFARPLPSGQAIKLNGSISDDWCIGDRVTCTYENACYNPKNGRREADLLNIEVSDWEPEPSEFGEMKCYKPVIYLYPEEETEVSVELSLKGRALTCTYPVYNDGWTVTAMPDGTLTDAKGQIYNYLYWEGETDLDYDFSEGFCVKGEDTAAFLEKALADLGLNRREANEFIVYWLPMMEQNPYNIISFRTKNYTEAAKLTVSPTPDSMLRVFMAWKRTEDFIEIPEQELTAPKRVGFTVVEWGGTEVKDDSFPDWGLALSVKNITPVGLTLVCTKAGGNPTGELKCGTEYHLGVLEDGTWKDVPTVIENYGWNSLAYWIPEGQDTEFDYSWEWLYGKLSAGTYRLTKSFMDFRETGDYDTAKYWVEFEIGE